MIKIETFIDLFAGIGGFRLVLEKYGLKCVFSSEWDKYSQKTYKSNFGDLPKGDITKIGSDSIPDHDVLVAGFPCQAFSISGKQLGFGDTRGTLFFEIARIVKDKRPKVLFLENVKNLERHDGGRTLKIILNTIEELGYNVYHKVLNASEYGVPTSRKRWYLVAFRSDLNIDDFKFPQKTLSKIYLKDVLEFNIDVSDYVINAKVNYNNKKVVSILGPIQIGKINSGRQGERVYSIEGHAITLSAYGGGIAAKTGAYLIDGIVRKLTPRECANIMGFPDNFIIPVSNSQAYKQFGNSVALPVIEKIFFKIMDCINDDKTRSKERI